MTNVPAQARLIPSLLAAVPSSTTIRVEGEPVRIRLRRFAPRGTPLQMGIPENAFLTQVTEKVATTRVRLSAGRGGRVTNDNARIDIFWFKKGVWRDNLSDMEAWLQIPARESNITLRPVRNRRATYPWVIKQWSLTRGRGRDRALGKAFIGRINGKYFAVMHQLPVDMLEGYGPRVDAVLKTLQAR